MLKDATQEFTFNLCRDISTGVVWTVWQVVFFDIWPPWRKGQIDEPMNYGIWLGGELMERGETDKPHSLTAARVILIDHLVKIQGYELENLVKKDGHKERG